MSSKKRRRRCLAVGFTLVELMVVIVIIGLLAGAATLVTRSYLLAGKQSVARMEISRICEALDSYYAACDHYPTSDEGIELLARPTPKFPEGLLNKVPRDPWGRPYEYLQPGRGVPYEIISFGADGREGGAGVDEDLSSRNLDRDDPRLSAGKR